MNGNVKIEMPAALALTLFIISIGAGAFRGELPVAPSEVEPHIENLKPF